VTTAAGIICSKLAIVFPPFIANDSTNWLSNWSFGVCPPLIDYGYPWILTRAGPVRYCACSKCVSWDLSPPAATVTQSARSQKPTALFGSRRTSERLPCPAVVTIPALGKTYWHFIKQAFVLLSAVCYVLEGELSLLTRGAWFSWNCRCGILPTEWVWRMQNLMSSNLCRLMIPH
jgi:hypothetical protein